MSEREIKPGEANGPSSTIASKIGDDAVAPIMQRLGTGPSPEGERMLGRLAARMFGAGPSEPERIGRFELRERLGAGAMGVVYEAWDPELDRRVAIKLLRDMPGRGRDPNSSKRLLREAKAMARLRHPNVVQVHEVGTHEGQVFVAMELIEGGSLRAWLSERERSWIEIVEVFSKAGRGLAAAHAAGLVHRDFKPDNVLIEDGRVFVGDFGLARTQQQAESDTTLPGVDEWSGPAESNTALTQTGAFVGTPAYMAPEAFGDETPEPRADQYSFCASLYEALYGVRAWPGETVSKLRAAKSRALASAPKQGPRTAKLPLWLRRAVVRGLAPVPADRFASMDALLLELARGLRRSRWLRRDLWIVLTVTGVVVGGAVSLGAGMFGNEPAAAPAAAPALCGDSPQHLAEVWEPSRRDRVLAALVASRPYAAEIATNVTAALDAYGQRWIASQTSACEATHVRGEQSGRTLDLRMRCLDRRLSELDALLARFETPTENDVLNSLKAVDALTPVDACDNLELLESTTPLPDDPQVRAEVERIRTQLDAVNAALATNALDGVKDRARAQLEAATELGYKPLTAEAGVAFGIVELRTGKPNEAKLLLEQAIVDAQASGHDEFAALAMISAIHVVGFQLRDFEAGERYVRQGRALLEHLGDPPRLLGSYLRNTGTFEFARGDHEQARVHSRAALELYAKHNGESHFSVAESRTNLAAIERRLGDLDGALALYERAKRDLEASLGPSHPGLFNPLNNMAAAYMIRGADGDDVKAEAHLREALAIAAQSMPPTHASIGHPHNNLGELLLGQGRYEQARASYDRAIESWTGSLGPKHLLLAHPLTGRGLAQLELGDLAGARSDLERAFALRDAQGGSKVTLAETEFILARALDALEEPRDEVTNLARRAREHLGEQDGDLVTRAQIDAWLEGR